MWTLVKDLTPALPGAFQNIKDQFSKVSSVLVGGSNFRNVIRHLNRTSILKRYKVSERIKIEELTKFKIRIYCS